MKKGTSVFHNSSFLYMWMGSTISELGGAFGTLCNSIIVYELTGSELALGSMWLIYFIPSLFLQLGIGPYIDKWSRKWIMVFSQFTRGTIFLIPLLMFHFNSLDVWHVYAVQIVIGLIQPLYAPASFSIIPTIISKELLTSANSYLDGTIRLMSFLAPPMGGLLVELIGVSFTLMLVCSFFVISGLLLMFLKEPPLSVEKVRDTWFQQFTEGIQFFIRQPILLWLGIFLAFVQFGVGVTMVINLPFIREELNGSYAQYGYFMAGFPLGYFFGSMLTSKIKLKPDYRRLIMLGSLMLGGLTYVSLSFTTSITIAIVIEVFAGIVLPFFNVNSASLYQQIVPNLLMGKVFSIRLFIIRAVMPLGVLTGGALGELWGIRAMFLTIGIIICSSSLLGVCLPYFRFLNVPVNKSIH